MRTTVELKDEYRAKLLQLAAERGEKGFSGLVNEAVDGFLRGLQDREDAKGRAANLLGSLSADDAEELRREVRKIRSHWR